MTTKAHPQLGSICPTDFGLKAGFWSGKKRDKLEFRPIIGWTSVTNYCDSGHLPFAAMVLGPSNRPMLLSKQAFPEFVGIFGKGLEPEQALEQLHRGEVTLGAIPGKGGALGGPLE